MKRQRLNKKEIIRKKIQIRHDRLNFIERGNKNQQIILKKPETNIINKPMRDRDQLRIFGKLDFQKNKNTEELVYNESLIDRIKQIKISKSIRFFKSKMMKKYDLVEYTNIDEPAVFMGMYTQADYENIRRHNTQCVVLWCGTDAMNLYKYINQYNLCSKKYFHIAFGEFVSNDLKKHNIEHKLLPITPSDITLTPCKKGDNVYFYTSKNNSNFYGYQYIDEIRSKTKLNIIVAQHNTYTYEKLIDIYKDCFIGLRLTQHDGLPNTVIELGLMGRRCIYNGNLPNSIRWENVNDISKNILYEYENRNIDNTKQIHDEMMNYLNIGNDWLYLSYHNRPKVSVIMNSFNENPKFFIEAILSYLNQKDVFVELIVSTVKNDPCIEVCKNYPIKLVINEKPSIWHQLNEGMKMATGDWITYASSNDVAINNKLKIEVDKCVQNNKEVCYSSFYKCNEDLSINKIINFHEYDYEKHLNGNYVSDCALFSKRLLDKYLPFNVEYANFAYYDFWLRIFEGEGNVFTYNDAPTWYYRITNKSRHVQKKYDLDLIRKEKNQKEAMLRSHKKE